jgi:hypothetical protein
VLSEHIRTVGFVLMKALKFPSVPFFTCKKNHVKMTAIKFHIMFYINEYEGCYLFGCNTAYFGRSSPIV